MSDLNELMDRDPLEYTKQDLDSIIAYHRRHHAQVAAGKKATKEDGPKLKIDLEALGFKKAPVVPTIRRRV